MIQEYRIEPKQKDQAFKERVNDLANYSIPTALKAWGLQVSKDKSFRKAIRKLAIEIAKIEFKGIK